jgi:hypothetical protein
MVFQATQNIPTELEELSVERDVEADGYVVGFEDAGGSFIEVGRLENVADNASDPLEIKHQNSGERVTVDNSGLKTQKIDDDRLYAGAFPGSNADLRLSNALTAASEGAVIFLENDVYSNNLTVNKSLTLKGTAVQSNPTPSLAVGTTVAAAWTIAQRNVAFHDINFAGGSSLTVNSFLCELLNIRGRNANSPIDINDNAIIITGGVNVDITFASGTADGLVDSCNGTSVIDNGTNTVGDIA